MRIYRTRKGNILLEALLNPQSESPEDPKAIETDVHLEMLVVKPETLQNRQQSQKTPPLDMDALCGDWKGGRKKPDLLIFKAAPGYMIASGKKPKRGETGECYLIHSIGGNLCYNAGEGTVYLSYEQETDTITLYPGGEYSRVEEAGK